MTQLASTADVRRALGLPRIEAMAAPTRLARVREVIAGATGSTVLPALVRLAARAADGDCAQLSLLADQQVATAVRCSDSSYSAQVSPLEESLCTVTVLFGDVFVVADAQAHPLLHDLPPVLSGAVGAYLGVPLLLADKTTVGALCVYGPQAREWTERHVGLTCDVADVIALELQRLVG